MYLVNSAIVAAFLAMPTVVSAQSGRDTPGSKTLVAVLAHAADDLHKSQIVPEAMQRVLPIMARALNGAVALIPAFPTASTTDLFR